MKIAMGRSEYFPWAEMQMGRSQWQPIRQCLLYPFGRHEVTLGMAGATKKIVQTKYPKLKNQ